MHIVTIYKRKSRRQHFFSEYEPQRSYIRAPAKASIGNTRNTQEFRLPTLSSAGARGRIVTNTIN